MKKFLLTIWLLLIFLAVGALFWYNELVYQLPTPIPANYKAVNHGKVIKLNNSLDSERSTPIFLHFFNPDCPCSRFNMTHFKALVKQYKGQVKFIVVVINNDNYTTEIVKNKFGLDIPVIFDASLAPACGVYSTPQAVLLDAQHALYYRGNYNQSRYCINEKTSYAKIAIAGLLQDHARLVFSPLALKAYGCSLPSCEK